MPSASPKLNRTFVDLPRTLRDNVGGRPSLSTLLPNLAACIAISLGPTSEEVLTPGAIEFVCMLEEQFGSRRVSLLRERKEVQQKINSNVFHLENFRPEN